MYRTIRGAIEGNAYGSFTTALYKYIQEPTLPNFLFAYGRAIGENKTLMQGILPGVNLQNLFESWEGCGLSSDLGTSVIMKVVTEIVVLPTIDQVAAGFPWLRWLDVPNPNPFSLDAPSLVGISVILHNAREDQGCPWEEGTRGKIVDVHYSVIPGRPTTYLVATSKATYCVEDSNIEWVDPKPQQDS